MDLLGGFSAGEWSPLNGIYNSEDHVDYDHDHDQFMAAHMDCAIANYNIIMGASSLEALPFTIWPSNDSTIVHDVAGSTYNQDHASKFGSSQIANYQPADTNSVASNVAFWGDRGANLFLINDHQWLNINHQEVSCNGEESGGSQTTAAHVVPQLKWEVPDQMMITVPDQSNMEDGSDLVSGNSNKRSRSSTPDDQDPKKYQRNVVKPRKNKKLGLSENEEDTSAGSGEHSDASHENLGAGMASSPSPSLKGAAAPNRNGKKRATRGSATDPQSIYARKRREKINERLRILQNLVPNGTKVDISTMLEEAVQYVKFLQLQIKLLSSDDLWMYAPLAYNGMDIGLDHLRLAAPRQL